VTGLHITADGTVFMNVQHPDDTNPEPFNMGTVGVIMGYVAGDDFEGLPVPAEGEVADHVLVAAGEYQVLARVGETLPGDANGTVFGAIVAHDGTVLNVCNDPDGNMFRPTEAGKGILYTNIECGVGGVSQLWIERDADGNWSATKGQMLDFVPVNGTGNNCGASVTPWNTGLSGEEYPADNEEDWQYWVEEQGAGFAALTGSPANPFDQGYNVELVPTEDGTQINKRYAMGRFSQEVAVVMPDQRTVYFGNDGTDRVMFKFVADTAGDLSAGTLYAAKVSQDGDTLNLQWIMLGQGNDTDIHAAIRELDAQFAS
jgi:secreted PhoX family phosphatase